MRSLISCFAFLGLAVSCQAATLSYHVLGAEAGSWPAIFSSIGLVPGIPEQARVVVAPAGSPVTDVKAGTILILEGESPLAASFGFRSTDQRVVVRSVEDLRSPKLEIVWEQALDLPVFEIPKPATIFARERWQKAPLVAGFRRGDGAVLWVAASPGALGYERFPYLPQALVDLGLDPPFRARNLWAFFDSSYRTRVDLDYMASKWRAAGIAALQVAAWHFWESDPASDGYLRRLIDACHRNAILVYAWFELPHVSEKFWNDHPDWREKTALLQDAQLDWRKLMNLAHPEAVEAVSEGMSGLLNRFDWDGVNLAELYFESLEGFENPARFTPMNDDVRSEFRESAGFDPIELFDEKSPHFRMKDSSALKQFIDFRADRARKQQVEWIARIEEIRRTKGGMDLVLTHVDDRFDSSMREKLGADAARVLPLLNEHDLTFLIEDPATIWNLGPRRYAQIADRYKPLTPRQNKLAIDINVVDRYQDVYPVKQQTGTELFELVHQAAMSFPRVALYFESSIAPADLPLLAASAAPVERVETVDDKIVVTSRVTTGIRWAGPALVDGKLWPLADDGTVWLPAGSHSIEPTSKSPVLRLLDFNGELISASASSDSVVFGYRSSARALAVLDRVPSASRNRRRRDTCRNSGQCTNAAPRPAPRHTLVGSS